jgi:hypothetical protein
VTFRNIAALLRRVRNLPLISGLSFMAIDGGTGHQDHQGRQRQMRWCLCSAEMAEDRAGPTDQTLEESYECYALPPEKRRERARQAADRIADEIRHLERLDSGRTRLASIVTKRNNTKSEHQL